MGPGGGPSRPWPATVGEEEEEGSATRGTAAAGAHPLLAAATIGRSGSSERLHPMPRSPHLRPGLALSLCLTRSTSLPLPLFPPLLTRTSPRRYESQCPWRGGPSQHYPHAYGGCPAAPVQAPTATASSAQSSAASTASTVCSCSCMGARSESAGSDSIKIRIGCSDLSCALDDFQLSPV